MLPLTPEEVAACNREQQYEMDKHKYYKSKEANRDVGKDAYLDWIVNYAKAWRDAWMQRREERLRLEAQNNAEQNNMEQGTIRV